MSMYDESGKVRPIAIAAIAVALVILGAILSIVFFTMIISSPYRIPSETNVPAPEIPELPRNPEIPENPLVPPTPEKIGEPGEMSSCGLQGCHGLDITCGDVSPDVACDMMYRIGDKCRHYAECGIVDGACRQIENAQFTACKSCAEACEKKFPTDSEKAFSCESTCGE